MIAKSKYYGKRAALRLGCEGTDENILEPLPP